MRKSLSALVLMVALCFSLCATASAASYVADDITYQNLNGQQLAIKIYTLLPDQNPDDLVEDDLTTMATTTPTAAQPKRNRLSAKRVSIRKRSQ